MLNVSVKHTTLYLYLKTVAGDGIRSLALAHNRCALANLAEAAVERMYM